jgi:hypothetical protein
MKVHPYPLEAIYMQAYETLQLEKYVFLVMLESAARTYVLHSDRYTDILLRRLNPLVSPSFHDYGRKIPLYALDLGCGSGHWLLEASNAWKTSQITGFDLVDTLIPEVLGQDNIQFVRGNLCVSSCSTVPSSNFTLPQPHISFAICRQIIRSCQDG